MFEVPFCKVHFFFDYHRSCFHRRSVELQRAGSGLLDKVITDTRSLKQIPLTEFSSDKDSGKWSFLRQHWGYLCLILRVLYGRWPVLHDRIAGSGVDPSRLLVFEVIRWHVTFSTDHWLNSKWILCNCHMFIVWNKLTYKFINGSFAFSLSCCKLSDRHNKEKVIHWTTAPHWKPGHTKNMETCQVQKAWFVNMSEI